MDLDSDYSPPDEDDGDDIDEDDYEKLSTRRRKKNRRQFDLDHNGPKFKTEPERDGHGHNHLSLVEELSYRSDDDDDDADDAAAAGRMRSRKREALEPISPPLFKRHRASFNHDYLHLLNTTIAEIATRQPDLEQHASSIRMPDSQLGLTRWTSDEKDVLFERLSRVENHSLREIAEELDVKSEAEVAQYVSFIRDAVDRRQSDGQLARVTLSDIPAATEIDPQCCQALEEAANAISARQGQYEEEREQMRWGRFWDITPSLAYVIDKYGYDALSRGPRSLAFLELFHLQHWLRLSERVFMNAAVPESNWSYIEEHRPSVWATALEDMHALAVSYLRRLVHTTLFISQARIRTKRVMEPMIKPIARRRDVEAALASLGAAPDRRSFWAKCARRLKLEVYDDDGSPPPGELTPNHDEPMDYDDVERRLSGEFPDVPSTKSIDDDDTDIRNISTVGRRSIVGGGQAPPLLELSEDYNEEEEEWDQESVSTTTTTGNGIEENDAKSGLSDRELDEEVQECMQYSVTSSAPSRRTRDALRIRLRAEREQEHVADVLDETRSALEEAALWKILRAPAVPAGLQAANEPKNDVETQGVEAGTMGDVNDKSD